MKAELRNDKVLVITPESVAEVTVLQKFVDGKVAVEKPQPFAANVEVLKIEVKE